MSNLTETIVDYVAKEGYAPLHPFLAMPYKYFEGGIVGRNKTIEYCFRLVDICPHFWLFGISEGTLEELSRAQSSDKIFRFPFLHFDPEWNEFYQNLASKYGDPLANLFPIQRLTKQN
ncbi:hypothetical protein J4455_02105 [Candidatus Woesearchaeota archaeon]|nr:hypothetical protein [Candidatus Woesearchaeota archaeon]